MELNIALRSEILEFSLIIENAINDLILVSLGIYDEKEKTRLFNNKGKITFQNKIDLLFDIEVLSKDENSELELLMIFRNKFLHDINCNSFSKVIEQLDNGIKSRFRMFLEKGNELNDEIACKDACLKLFLKNIATLKIRFKENRLKIENRNELYQIQNNHKVKYIDLIFDLVNDLYIILENSELEDEKVFKLSEQVNVKLENTINKLSSDNEMKTELDNFLGTPEKLKRFFGFVKITKTSMPNWNDLKTTDHSNL